MRKAKDPFHSAVSDKTERLSVRGLQPRSEARFFLKLFMRGCVTFEQAKADILMTPRQLNFLIREGCGHPDTLRAIAFNRLRSWQEFCVMHREATRQPCRA